MTSSTSALELWFIEMEAISKEVTHQTMLKKLLADSVFSNLLLKTVSKPITIKSEPEKGLFDLGVSFEDGTDLLIEIKMWSSLFEKQVERQTEFLKAKEGRRGIYLLLGLSDYEYSPQRIATESAELSTKLSYPELIQAIDEYTKDAEPSALKELAQGYRNALHHQSEWLRNAWKTETNWAHAYYYSAFGAVQKMMPDIETKIFTANLGNADYLLQASGLWKKFVFENIGIYIYLEVSNGEICIRCANKMENQEAVRRIRRHLYAYFEPQMKTPYPEISNQGKISKWMKVVRMPFNIQQLGIERSAEIFRDWYRVVEGCNPF